MFFKDLLYRDLCAKWVNKTYFTHQGTFSLRERTVIEGKQVILIPQHLEELKVVQHIENT